MLPEIIIKKLSLIQINNSTGIVAYIAAKLYLPLQNCALIISIGIVC